MVLGDHVEPVAWSQLELQEVAIDVRYHALKKKALLGLVEGEGCWEDPLGF